MVPLEPGIRVNYAPRFHSARDWSARLSLNSGVEIAAGRVIPRNDWRPPTLEELALLVAADVEPAGTLALFNIPDRLLQRWWELAATEPADADSGSEAFQKFANEILEFLHFKQIPLPPACVLEVVLNAPGLSSTRLQSPGLTTEPLCPSLLGGINLSDEESAQLFLNLGSQQMGAKSFSGSLFEQAAAFVASNSDYPFVRLTLLPGEGYWLPIGGLLLDGDTRERSDIDVELLIRTG